MTSSGDIMLCSPSFSFQYPSFPSNFLHSSLHCSCDATTSELLAHCSCLSIEKKQKHATIWGFIRIACFHILSKLVEYLLKLFDDDFILLKLAD